MSSEFDSSDAEDEMLLSYVDSYRKQMAIKEQQLAANQSSRQTVQPKVLAEDSSTTAAGSSDLRADLHVAKGQIAVLKEKYDRAETVNKENREQFNREKKQMQSSYLQELQNLKNEINNLNDEKLFLKQKLNQSKRRFDSSANTSVDTQEKKDPYTENSAAFSEGDLSVTAKQLLSKKLASSKIKEELIEKPLAKIKTETKYEDVDVDENDNGNFDDNDNENDNKNEPMRVKQKPGRPGNKIAGKKQTIFNFKTTLKFNDNYNLMSYLSKYQIPGMPETVIHYLDTESRSGSDYFKNRKLGSDFLRFGNELIITETLSKFIELLLDFCLTRLNEIIELSNEQDSKYIPFLLALIYQIINYRASACDVTFLTNLFMVLFDKLAYFDYIFKLKSIYDPKLTMILPKYEVVHFNPQEQNSKKWINLGTETSLINDENLFLKQHTTLLSTSYNAGNDFSMEEFENYRYQKSRFKNKLNSDAEENETPQDHLYEVPNFNNEFLDFLIVVYTFDILETVISNIDFLVSEEQDEEIIDINKRDFDELVESYLALFKLSFTNSFQPLIQPLFSNVKMFANFFSLSCKLNLDLNRFVDLISVQCDWLVKINLKNYLHKLPVKYHVVSLKRYINGGDNISYINLILPLVKIMNNEINYIPDCNKFIIIHKACELLTGNILKNLEGFLDTWFTTYSLTPMRWSLNIDDVENSVITKILKSCTTLFTSNFLATKGSKNKKDLDLKRANAVQCIKILQLFQMNLDAFSGDVNSASQALNHDKSDTAANGSFSLSQLEQTNQNGEDADSISARLKNMNEKLAQLIINDESWKKELVVFISRVIFQDQKNLLLKHELLKDFLRDLLDSLVTFDESEAIYDTLII